MTTLAQKSFAAGEISPDVAARSDQVKYVTGLRTLRNAYVMRHGGATNRPGTIMTCDQMDYDRKTRQIPFVFNSDQTYNLQFSYNDRLGGGRMRVIRNGAQLYDRTLTISGITNANPGVVTYVGDDSNPFQDQEIRITGVVGPMGKFLNGRNFILTNVNTVLNTCNLKYLNGDDVDTTAFGAYTSDGTIEMVYEIETPYLEAHLFEIVFSQSADVILITHPSYETRELTRSGHTSWTLTEKEFSPTQVAPTDIAYSSIAAGAVMHKYKVTAVSDEGREESLEGAFQAKAITAATQANPCAVTAVGHGYTTGDVITIDGVLGMTQLNGNTYTITVTGANTFTLGVDSTAYGAYTGGGNARRTGFVGAAPTSADPHIISWAAAAGAIEYNIYKDVNGVFGFLGVAGGTTFNDVGAAPDTADTPPLERNPFEGAGNYPAACAYSQQRAFFGGSTNDPETLNGSRIGHFGNFTVSQPLQDDDAISAVMGGSQVNIIKHLLEIVGKLTVFTSGGEIALLGDANGAITATTPNPKQFTYNGIGDVRPLPVGGGAIYVQARGSVVREFRYDDIKGTEESDLSIFSAHLLEGHSIVDWCYQQTPHSIIWAVRDDGVLIGLTYIREHVIVGWHRHDFDGLVESVCSIPEDGEDALYLGIKRTIDGETRRYTERMASRKFTDIKDAVFVDCGLSYDGRNVEATTMTLSGSGWTYTDDLTLTSNPAFFTSDDVGNEIHLTGSDGTLIRCEIVGYTNTTTVTVRPNKTVPVSMRAVAITDWGKAVDELSGLWHIEGEDVSILADGFVEASPNNDSYDIKTVTNGIVTLDTPAVVVHVGLPIIGDMETLDPDFPDAETMIDKKKRVSKVTVLCKDTRGLFFGPIAPEDSEKYEDDPNPLLGLDELKIRGEANENYDDPVALLTGAGTVLIRSPWRNKGSVFLRQVDPLPFTVLAIAPAGSYPIRR